jgi:hypothetical protein
MGRGKYGQKDDIIREKDNNIMAVHKVTGKMFGGKASGTHVGYDTLGHLKQAMKYAEVSTDEFFFVKLSFTEGDFSRPTPTFTYLEG